MAIRKIELETPIDELSEADLLETFSDVMEAHESNVEEYEALEAEAGKATQYSEEIEGLEADLGEAKLYFSAKASEVTNISEDLLAERFSMTELVEMAGKADEAAEVEFSEGGCGVEGCNGPDDCADPDDDDCADDEAASVFAEKPQKSPAFSADALAARKEAARQRLSGVDGITL